MRRTADKWHEPHPLHLHRRTDESITGKAEPDGFRQGGSTLRDKPGMGRGISIEGNSTQEGRGMSWGQAIILACLFFVLVFLTERGAI